MIQIRRSIDRGYFDHGWLQTYHTFSFANYYDPHFMGFRELRVINQDTVSPGEGFGTHTHNDMEIITFVIRGAVTHRDSMGNHGVIRAGEIQCMSAGTGVRHSEFNDSKTEPLELLQIWIIPDQEGLTPSYQQMTYSQQISAIQLLVSPNAEQGSLKIHQDVKLFLINLTANEKREYSLAANRYAWVQIVRGQIKLNDKILNAGDGASISGETLLSFIAMEATELLLFDLN